MGMRDLRLRLREQFPLEISAPSAAVAALDALGRPAERQVFGRPCAICFDLVHSKAEAACCPTCGVNMHSECFAQWRAVVREDTDATLCPSCRAAWDDDDAVAASKLAP